MSDDYVPPAKRCTVCDRPAVDPTSNAPVCATHHEQIDTASDGDTGDHAVEDADTSGWGGVAFDAITPDTYPDALLTREQWMGQLAGEKMPFAPWGDRDHPDAAPDADARYKWGLSENYTDGDTVALAEDDPRLDGRVFIQQESDPFAFVDGDDVRDPETGDVHPTFIDLLARLGFTYADVSTSGAGVHAYYRGDLPGDQGQAVFEIDTEPWGANDDPPTVEIYANTHVCVTTGDHVTDTPTDVREWNRDAVESILDEYDARKESNPEPVGHDTDHDHLDVSDYDPDATDADDTATDLRDVLKAVDQLRPRDLPLQARQVGTDATGWEQWNPSSYRTSSGNDSLHRPPDEPVFHDHKHNESFGVLSLFAAEQGILRNPWGRLAGEAWWAAVEQARDAGAPIPEYVGSRDRDADHTAVLPPSVRDLTTAASGWDWRNTATSGRDTLTMQDARERTQDALRDAYESGDRVLIDALPTTGKSYGSIAAAADTGEPITVVTGRGRKEMYAQYRQWADDHGLSHYTVPSFTHDCPTANGSFGDDWADTVRSWYNRGATPQEIHKAAEYVLGRPLPCQENGPCPYKSKWDFDPDDYDVLIGHYNHAHKSKVTAGRTLVIDEFPEDSYVTQLGTRLPAAVSYWLQTTPEVPYDDYTDLIENRDDDQRRADALLWFENNDPERDEQSVLDDADAHAAAPLAVFTILAGDDLGNGLERATLPNGVGLWDRENGGVSLLQPPDLRYTSGVVALDGTPTVEQWETALGSRMNHRQVLADSERREYVRETLNQNIVRTTDYVKPYNPKPSDAGDRIAVEKDAALLERVHDLHDERPGVITTTTAEREYDGEPIEDHIDTTQHYGNVLGSNRFKTKRVGAVIGSQHYGDRYIQRWGAFAGNAVERNDGKGQDLSYGAFGDDLLQHMREHQTLQAVMRFGRDGNGSVVYVHTDTLPEWVPIAGEGRVVTTWSDGMTGVLNAVEALGGGTTAEIASHPAVDVSTRQVFNHLETLRERGVVDREQDASDGRRVVWCDDGVHRVNDHGAVELDSVEVADADAGEVDALARTTTYTCHFSNREVNTDRPTSSPERDPPATDTNPSETGVSGPNPPE
jgi:hypothetical protein